MQPSAIDYSNKRVLLIESSGNMRSTIVYMLRRLGIANIQAITINDQVFDRLKEEEFDIVLLGHNSSDPLTGMQLLEEARYRGYMKPDACWIFMTSDSSQEVILYAIDHQPDALITKPFTMEELKARLDVLIYRKDAMRHVEEAIAKGQLDLAVKLCDKIELSGSNYDYVQLVKGRLLLKMNRFEEAEHFFKHRVMNLSEKDVWLCLAQAYIGQEHYVEARDLLDKLLEKYPLLLAAYDLQAHVLEKLGELMPAQDTLHSATQKCPINLLRQMELGRVASHTRTLSLAENAYRKSIALGKHSCYRSPEPYLRLANVYRLSMADAADKDKFALNTQFEQLLNTAAFNFPKDKTLKVKTALLRSQFNADLGETDDANRFLKEASILAGQLEQPIDIQRTLLDLAGDGLPLLEQSVDTEAVSAKAASKHDPEMSAKVNRLGVKHYMADKMAQAIRYFGLAIEYDSKNSKALLNLAQLFLESARQQSARRDERLKMVSRYLRLTDRMALNELESQKQALLKRFMSQPLEKMPEGSLGPLLR